MRRQVNLSDVHAPYHHPAAWALALQIIGRIRPDVVNILGDLLDFYKLSSFDKDPDKFNLQVELDTAAALLSDLRRVHRKRIRFVPGNHELRIKKYLRRNPELHGLAALSLPNLLDLKALDIEFYDHEVEIVPGPGGLYGHHGRIVRPTAGLSAKAELEAQFHATSLIGGHTHRAGKYVCTTRFGKRYSVENGCLCRLDPDYVPGTPNWQLAISVTEINGDEHDTHVVPFYGEGDDLWAVVFGEEIRL